MNTSFQLYRGAKIGDCLYQSLFELIEAGSLSEELADKVLAQFDKSMYHALEEKVVEKRALIKANLKSYRYIDSVWQFVLDKVTLKVPGNGRPSSGTWEEEMDSAKLVCVDSKLVLKDKAEAEVEAARQVVGQGMDSGLMGTVPEAIDRRAAGRVEEHGLVGGWVPMGVGNNQEEDAKTESE